MIERVTFHKPINLNNERHPTFSKSYSSVVSPGKSCNCVCKCSAAPPDPPHEENRPPHDHDITEFQKPSTGATPNLQKRAKSINRDSSESSTAADMANESRTIYNKDGTKGRIVDRKLRSTKIK